MHSGLLVCEESSPIVGLCFWPNLACRLCTEEIDATRFAAAGGVQLSTFGSINRKSMLCLPPTTRDPGTASLRSSRGRHHLHVSPGSGSIQYASRANVKMEGSRSSPQSNSSDDPEHSHLPTLLDLVKAHRPDEAAGIGMLCGRQCSPRCAAAKVAE